MSDEATLTPREALERKKARLLEEVAAVDREMAEHDQLAALAEKYPDQFAALAAKLRKNESVSAGINLLSLIERYRSHERSAYRQLRHKTRESYESLLRRLERELGPRQIQNLDRELLERAHTEWANVSGVPMAHSLITMLRALARFGATVLEDRACRELRLTLHDMHFSVAKRHAEPLTREHVVAIRRKAHEMGLGSLALAQAFQFDCELRQKDVIGEWVPKNSDPEDSGVTHGDLKWLRGIRWENVDQRLVLRHRESFSLKEIEVNLRSKRMVLEELMRMYSLDETEVFDRSNLPANGPIIIREFDHLPYQTHEFRRQWRRMAEACGFSKNLRNMDSRPRATQGANARSATGKKHPFSGQTETHERPKADMEDLDLARGLRH
jgi:hypothetical protein